MFMENNPKSVAAHFMVGNTYPYSQIDWAEDMKLAGIHSLDAFALNVGREDWQLERIADCFQAALDIQTDFKLFLCFDMSTFPCERTEDIDKMCAYFTQFATHPNYLQVNGRALVSTFSGENVLFGHTEFLEAWTKVKHLFETICKVAFVPSFFIDPGRYQELEFADGAFNWNGCWPVHLTNRSARSDIICPKIDSDEHHLHHLRGKQYMASISPWFFTHYGRETWNKNWIYRGDDWLLVRRWEHLLSIRSQVDIVQIISWNDYGESHYIGPIKGAQPNSEAWVNGFDHTPWLHLNAYFIRAFKEGAFPSIDKFRVYVWARPHTKVAEARVDAVGRPDGWELTDDVFWVVVLAPAHAQVALRSGHSEASVTHQITKGYAKLQHPLVEGGTMHVKVVCDGQTVVNFVTEGFEFSAHPETYNFNAFVAMYPPDDD